MTLFTKLFISAFVCFLFLFNISAITCPSSSQYRNSRQFIYCSFFYYFFLPLLFINYLKKKNLRFIAVFGFGDCSETKTGYYFSNDLFVEIFAIVYYLFKKLLVKLFSPVIELKSIEFLLFEV